MGIYKNRPTHQSVLTDCQTRFLPPDIAETFARNPEAREMVARTADRIRISRNTRCAAGQ